MSRNLFPVMSWFAKPESHCGELTRQMRSSICDQPDTGAARAGAVLSAGIGCTEKGSYGYLPKQAKKIVDEIVDQMGRLPVVSECYDQWWQLQCQVDDHYSEKERKRPKLSELRRNSGPSRTPSSGRRTRAYPHGHSLL
ncbi:MAG: hypothetical protein ACLU9S_00495 [Oscillospiraceae bacterium]